MRKATLLLFFVAFTTLLAQKADSYLYIQSIADTLTVVPLKNVVGYTVNAGEAQVYLFNGKALVVKDVTNISEECPVELPRFTSYRFNSKYNDQLFQTVAASEDELLRDTIHLSVGQIGKSLTATFQLPDEAVAWVGTERQESKVTRQRMTSPVTYTIGRDSWRQFHIAIDKAGIISYEYIPFGRQVTVSVDFLTDHPMGSYNVPRIDISTATGSVPLSKTTYIAGTITVDGGGVFPDMQATDILVKGRGNTSWSATANSKNSYHFKFSEKQRPLGMTGGKHWVLLSNKQSGSMLCNALEQKASALAGCAAVCHIVPVELYINGSYRGSYNLTEEVGFHSNSVSLGDESCAAMLELDTYADEAIWRSNAYGVSTKIHEPDFDDDLDDLAITKNDVINDWNAATEALRYGDSEDYTGCFELNSLVSYLFVNELCYNTELQHPKSVFLYSENVVDDGFKLTGVDETPWIFGPMWDCDWSFGYNVGSKEYFVNCAEEGYYTQNFPSCLNGFWYDLRFRSHELDKAYYTLWYNFMNDGRMQELIDYAADYYGYAAPSLRHNSANETSQQDGFNYSAIAKRAASWFRRRANFVFSTLTAYDIDEKQKEPAAVPYMTDAPDGLPMERPDMAKRNLLYDLSGRRVLDSHSVRPGIYITSGGQKVRIP